MLWFRGSFTLYFPFAIFIQHIQGLSIQDSSKITKFYPFSQSSIQESIPNLSQIDDKSIELPLDSRSTFIDVSLGKKSPNFLMKQYGQIIGKQQQKRPRNLYDSVVLNVTARELSRSGDERVFLMTQILLQIEKWGNMGEKLIQSSIIRGDLRDQSQQPKECWIQSGRKEKQ